MRFLFSSLVVLGIVAFVNLFTYAVNSKWYKNDPEAEKTDYFKLLESFFERKYMKAVFLAVGIICFAAAIVVFDIYDLAAV